MYSAGREQNDDAILAKIEELLDIKITSIKEIREINLKLDALFYKGDIGMKNWQTMKKVIRNKYKEMTSKVLKSEQDNTQEFSIQTQTTNSTSQDNENNETIADLNSLKLHTSFADDFLLEEQLRICFGDEFFELLSPEEIDIVKEKYSTCEELSMDQELSFGNKRLDQLLEVLKEKQLNRLLGENVENIESVENIDHGRRRFM